MERIETDVDQREQQLQQRQAKESQETILKNPVALFHVAKNGTKQTTGAVTKDNGVSSADANHRRVEDLYDIPVGRSMSPLYPTSFFLSSPVPTSSSPCSPRC